MKFLPTTKEEMKNLGWDSIDVLLISGDTYLDTSYNGSALIGKWLVEHGVNLNMKDNPSFLTAVRYCDEKIIQYIVSYLQFVY